MNTLSVTDRKQYIGSSDAAAICGLNPYRSAVDVWLEKTGRKEPDDISGKKAVRRGKMLEPIIRNLIAAEAGIVIDRFNVRYVEDDGLHGAEIDFEFTADGEAVNGEIKTAYSRKDWGEEWSDEIPDTYMAQVIHAQTVTKRRKTLVVAAFGFDDFRYYMVEHDADLAAWVRQQETGFWACVESDTAPEPRTLEDAYGAYFKDAGTSVDATPETIEDVLLWRGLDKQIKGLTDQRDSVELRLCRTIGENQALLNDGRAIFTWKAQNHSHLDQKRLKADAPDLVKQYTVTKQIRVARAAGGEL